MNQLKLDVATDCVADTLFMNIIRATTTLSHDPSMELARMFGPLAVVTRNSFSTPVQEMASAWYDATMAALVS